MGWRYIAQVYGVDIFTNVVVVWPTTGRRVIRYTSYNRTGGILSNTV